MSEHSPHNFAPQVGAGAASLLGRRVGNYQLVNRIGGGGFGDVYRAEHAELGNPFAVKVLHPRFSTDAEFVERFRHEAMVLAGLRHENVVQVVDFGEIEQIGFYLVMEWIEGTTLHRYWRKKRVLPVGQVFALFSQLLDALELAHGRGIVHRDMKPENLMLTKGGRGRTIVKIVDFGIAKIVGQSAQGSGLAIGTPYYMSPEQAAGQERLVDHRADIYACGVILTELLTGRRLFQTKDPKEILRHQIESAPPTLLELNPKREYPEALQAVINRALAKRPSERYASASEFFDELNGVMRAEGIQPDDQESTWNDNLTATSTNLLTLMTGVSAAELPDVANSTASQILGQKASPDELSSMSSLPAVAPPSKSRWPLWSGIGLGLVLALVIGILMVTTQKPKDPKLATNPPNLGGNSGTRIVPPSPQDAGNAAEPTLPEKDMTVTPEAQPPEENAVEEKKAPRSSRRRRKRRKTRRRRKRRAPKRRTRVAKVTPRETSSPKKREPETRTPAVRKVVQVEVRKIRLTSTPNGATIFINGDRKGVTPFTAKVPSGKFVFIKLKKKGYVDLQFRWQANKNDSRHLKLIEDLL
ncbi:MAG: serine/threonine protein kinase [Myxococcales bacterium]|nr:serine/threonine protein kinase [Myxococcales bacterium]